MLAPSTRHSIAIRQLDNCCETGAAFRLGAGADSGPIGPERSEHVRPAVWVREVNEILASGPP